MKKHLLLIASILFGVGAYAQFDNTNSPTAGMGATLYTLDSNATAYDNITGTGVTWDYSTTPGYGPSATSTITVYDASSTPNASSFTSSTRAIEMQGTMMNYFTDDASGRVSQGFVFQNQTTGDVIAMYDTDQENLYTYPFNVGDVINDVFSGSYSIPSFSETGSIDGTIYATVDGQGTLKLHNNDYTNVLRYKLVDTVNVYGVSLLGDVQMRRIQYEYYDFTTSDLPIFVHSSIAFVNKNTGDALFPPTHLVLSLESATGAGVISESVLAQTKVYPNPADGAFNIQLPSAVKAANISIMDALGRTVDSFSMNQNEKTISTTQYRKGVYFVKIISNNNTVTKRIVIQ